LTLPDIVNTHRAAKQYENKRMFFGFEAVMAATVKYLRIYSQHVLLELFPVLPCCLLDLPLQPEDVPPKSRKTTKLQIIKSREIVLFKRSI
jgi:hypothetical protein